MWTELQNLKESNEFLNLLLDNIDSAVLIADENLRIHQFNKSFLSLFDSYFSIICMVLDANQGLLTYSCAGHPPPVLLGATRPLEFLNHRGPVIGVGCQTPFTQEELRLHKGDKLVLYTYGLLECRNAKGDYYGKSRFADLLANHRSKPIREIVDTVYGDVKDFRGQAKPDDDISILGMEY